MPTLNKDPKNEITKFILNLISSNIDIPLYTTRPENEPLPYIRLVRYNGMDSDFKNVENGFVILGFHVYSADASIKEVSEYIGQITEIIKLHAYECPYIARVNQDNLYIMDVNKPDIRQGEIAYRFKYYK